MSGQLVGEVLDAAEAGRLVGLSRGDVLALVAIAEKCHAATRQGSVRMTRIQAVMNQSRTTAWRAVRTLKDRELIRVVKRGYESHGTGHANVYEVAVLVPPKMKHATTDACATQDETCTGDVHVSNPAVHVSPMDGTHDGLNDGKEPPLPPAPPSPAPPVTQRRPKAAPKKRTQIRDDYMPPDRVIAAIRAEFPAATNDDLSYQHRKFIDHWRKTGKPMADWDAAWRNWIRTANERGELCRGRNGMSRGDAKVTGWLNAGKTQPTTTPEITP
jgi:hypothetical protein